MRSGRVPRFLRELDASWWASLALAAAFVWLCAAGAMQTGTGWDEVEHRKYGQMSVEFYRTFGAERTATTYWTNYYGAFHALVGSFFEWLLPHAHWPTARHLGTVAFSLVGFLYTVRLARLLAGPAAGLAAALLLATTPRWVGDSMFNPCDIPTGAMYVTALFYLAKLAGELESARLGTWLLFGVTTGLTLAIRFIGLLLMPYLALALGAWALLVRPRAATLREHGPRLLWRFVLAGIVATAVTFALWPRLMVEPWETLLDTLQRTKSYPWMGKVFFQGEFHSGHELPRTYLAVWFGLTTPLATLLGVVLAVVCARVWVPRARGPWLRAGVIAFATLFPPAYAAATHATIYDGIRHFLFVLPPLTALGAAGWAAAFGVAKRVRRWAPVAVAAVLVLLSAEPAAWYARLHPYEYVYFNPLAGGLARASHSYETDYWGLSLREAAEWLEEHRREIVGSDAPLRLVTNAPMHLLLPFVPDESKYASVAPDQPFNALLFFYRGLPLGWNDDPPPTVKKTLVEGQIPFWQIYVKARAPSGAKAGG